MTESNQNRDGDLFIIRFIKQNPMIWDSSHKDYHDRDKRNDIFKELAAKIGQKPEFVKRRWITQRERYVKGLRSKMLKSDTPFSYKYNDEMNFLKNHVKMKIQTQIRTENPDFNENSSENQEPEYEFVITEEDLRHHDEEEGDMSHLLSDFFGESESQSVLTIVEELPEEEILPESTNEGIFLDVPDEMEISTTTKPIILENISLSEPKVVPNTPQNAEVRNEDVIFGELIASQLMKITDEAKKKAIKRSILDLFF
ncbi:uncharacterized protein LOC134834806 [Culicoides brevitarsis]|uniref:uncharacterized protein LOC134834806 n=1 Tax=Culicoides brevitarsis TaxID=469753 RepID=UPI00307C662E